MDVEPKIPRTIAYVLLTPSIVTVEDHVCQTCGGPPGAKNRDIHLTFSGPRLQRGYRRYVTITKPRCASLRSAIT